MKTTTNGSSRTSEPFVNRMRNASTTTKNNAKRPTGNDSMNILEYIMPRIRSIAFVDFTKAFDCITLELLFLALGKAWMPCSALSKFKLSGHSILKCTQDCIDGELANPIEYNSGVKQRCKLAPTLFGMYAAGMLYLAFKDMDSFYSIKVVSDTMTSYLISGVWNQRPRYSPNTHEKPNMQPLLPYLPTMVLRYSVCYPHTATCH